MDTITGVHLTADSQELSQAQQLGALRFHTALPNAGTRPLFTANGYVGRGPPRNVSVGMSYVYLFCVATLFIIRKKAKLDTGAMRTKRMRHESPILRLGKVMSMA